jgi:hypothetical protein
VIRFSLRGALGCCFLCGFSIKSCRQFRTQRDDLGFQRVIEHVSDHCQAEVSTSCASFSFRSPDGRKPASRRAAMMIVSRVRGLRPWRAFFSFTTKLPKPRRSTRSLERSASEMVSSIESRIVSVRPLILQFSLRRRQSVAVWSPSQCIQVPCNIAQAGYSATDRDSRRQYARLRSHRAPFTKTVFPAPPDQRLRKPRAVFSHAGEAAYSNSGNNHNWPCRRARLRRQTDTMPIRPEYRAFYGRQWRAYRAVLLGPSRREVQLVRAHRAEVPEPRPQDP